MKRGFVISLQNRLTLTNALFISLALGLLTVTINIFTGLVFNALVRENISEQSGEIVRMIEEQYNPMSRSFDAATVEAMGMYFVHEGYIVTVEDESGDTVWNARSCDMRQCMDVMNAIAERMEGRFGVNGALQRRDFPVVYANRTVGTISIETYGPFFYSETESRFLTSVNRLLLIATAVLTLLSIAVSTALSRAIARPILTAAEAARRIARVHSGGTAGEPPAIRVDDHYKTTELALLSRSINELAAELEAGERRQKQLTADIAHELRTPLTCLRGSVEAMIDGVFRPDRERLESCHEEIIRLSNLVQDLHTLTGLEWDAITLNKTDFDLGKLLQITAEQFMPEAHEKGIRIWLDLQDSPVTADYDRLKQVFINLLSNAVKYTDQGGVTITVRGGEVTIADTGIGIPETDLPHVFERFYRSDKSRGRDTGGSGIGLTIAAAIIAAHGGTISAENAASAADGLRGSVFRVRV